jgi:hypothetical protein
MCHCSEGDPPKVFDQVLRKSKRVYRCCECRRNIPRGTWYQEVSGLWDDTWDRFQTCLRCAARREAFRAIEGCWPGLTELKETLSECMRGSDGWIEYGRAVRKSHAEIRAHIAQLEAARLERYRMASLLRRTPPFIAEGI